MLTMPVIQEVIEHLSDNDFIITSSVKLQKIIEETFEINCFTINEILYKDTLKGLLTDYIEQIDSLRFILVEKLQFEHLPIFLISELYGIPLVLSNKAEEKILDEQLPVLDPPIMGSEISSYEEWSRESNLTKFHTMKILDTMGVNITDKSQSQQFLPRIPNILFPFRSIQEQILRVIFATHSFPNTTLITGILKFFKRLYELESLDTHFIIGINSFRELKEVLQNFYQMNINNLDLTKVTRLKIRISTIDGLHTVSLKGDGVYCQRCTNQPFLCLGQLIYIYIMKEMIKASSIDIQTHIKTQLANFGMVQNLISHQLLSKTSRKLSKSNPLESLIIRPNTGIKLYITEIGVEAVLSGLPLDLVITLTKFFRYKSCPDNLVSVFRGVLRILRNNNLPLRKIHRIILSLSFKFGYMETYTTLSEIMNS